jgi:hypothetical protein
MDKGGGFYFYSGRDGITTDGTYLYVANSGNSRIDKITLAGAYVGSTSTRADANYSVSWTNNATTLATFYSWVSNAPMGIWNDGTYIYGASYNPSGSGSNCIVFKLNKSTGNMIGWQGNVGTQPTGGDTGCSSTAAGTTTPGWCQGGNGATGYTLGKFSNATSVSGDANFIYVNDEGNHRVTRIPK